MLLNRYSLAALLLVSIISSVSAQQPGLMPQPQAVIIYQKPVEQVPAPQTVVSSAPCTQTVCVNEPKKNTKVVYTSRCKEFCVPSCSLFSLFSSDCGCSGNCEKKTKNVLVKKVVPGCDTTQCVLKEVPAGACAPCQTSR